MTIEITFKNEDYIRVYNTYWFIIENNSIVFRDSDTGELHNFSLDKIERIENA